MGKSVQDSAEMAESCVNFLSCEKSSPLHNVIAQGKIIFKENRVSAAGTVPVGGIPAET